jgi:hypothetical protein
MKIDYFHINSSIVIVNEIICSSNIAESTSKDRGVAIDRQFGCPAENYRKKTMVKKGRKMAQAILMIVSVPKCSAKQR